MKRSAYSWNAAVVSAMLAAAPAAASGCPASSQPAGKAPSTRPSPKLTSGERQRQDAVPASHVRLPSDQTQAAPEVAQAAPPPEGGPERPTGFSPPPVEKQSPTLPASPPSEANIADWPQPQFVLLLTGRQNGYIEPCGCTGLANQKGGLARRHTLYDSLANRGWNVLPFDAGNQVRRYGRQSEIKFQVTAEGLKKMNYRAVALGPDDLRLSAGELLAAVTDAGDTVSPFLWPTPSCWV